MVVDADGQPALWRRETKVGQVPQRFRTEALAQAAADRMNSGDILLTDEAIEASIKQAFKPFRCVVEILPDRHMRFQVIKQRRPTPIYTEPGIPIEAMREDDDLLELLRSVRRILEKQGYRLSPW